MARTKNEDQSKVKSERITLRLTVKNKDLLLYLGNGKLQRGFDKLFETVKKLSKIQD